MEKRFSIWGAVVLSAVIGASVVASSHLLADSFGASSRTLANGFNQIAKPDRTVVVRGLAEQEVDANLAIWKVSFRLGGMTLQALQKDIIDKSAIVAAYLQKYGLETSDYTVLAPNIELMTLNVYSNQKVEYPYIASQSFLVRSDKISAVKTAQRHALELLTNDISLDQNYDNQVRYEYTALNTIKPKMIAEATQNARDAAQQFAKDSKSKVGSIKKATQGYFSVEDAASGLEEKKKIRVVTTIEYLLTD